ncbi:hypothetical protein [Streptomyces sp. NPDC005017]|uniref:hypothetical protein n=1 Tax=Streptomyces sp. NPDC005017 TaxID=3364706 RepID=UPI003695EFCF
MTETTDSLDAWTSRLLGLGEGISPEAARTFVHDLYAHAQADLDEGRAEAEFQREE